MAANIKGNISEEKAKKIAVGATVAGVLLIVFLLIILIVQFVQIGVLTARDKEYETALQQHEQLLEQGKSAMDYYSSTLGLYRLARQYGWR